MAGSSVQGLARRPEPISVKVLTGRSARAHHIAYFARTGRKGQSPPRLLKDAAGTIVTELARNTRVTTELPLTAPNTSSLLARFYGMTGRPPGPPCREIVVL